MKILAVADEESKYLWEYYEPSKLRDIDLIIGCGVEGFLQFAERRSPAGPLQCVHP